MDRLDVRREIARFIRVHPEMTFREISTKLGVGMQTLRTIARENGLSRPKTLARLNLKPETNNEAN